MRGLLGLVIIPLFLISATAGCRPSGPTQEMGTVVQEIPAVEGADEPYIIPELGPPLSQAKAAENAKPSPVAKPK